MARVECIPDADFRFNDLHDHLSLARHHLLRVDEAPGNPSERSENLNDAESELDEAIESLQQLRASVRLLREIDSHRKGGS